MRNGDFNTVEQQPTLHDLRRTIATALVNYLGVPKERVSRVLNHRKVDRDGAAATELYIQTDPAMIEPELVKYHAWLCVLSDHDQMVESVWNESERGKAGPSKVTPIRRVAG